ncbi:MULTISPECIES: hypothetical protein [Kribbella]|nr:MULTISPECIES: hypothetical protein [Kribbella]
MSTTVAPCRRGEAPWIGAHGSALTPNGFFVMFVIMSKAPPLVVAK